MIFGSRGYCAEDIEVISWRRTKRITFRFGSFVQNTLRIKIGKRQTKWLSRYLELDKLLESWLMEIFLLPPIISAKLACFRIITDENKV